MQEIKQGALCWVCEKPLDYPKKRNVFDRVFGPVVITNTGNASACEKCATHIYKVIADHEVKLCKK